ncbi:MAG: DegT/DnrJ/EryC1/StrS family aminotransferase [Desulfovibrionaceae bacterium]|nr:DegT/DnrJ/EryC1/StrS family aminotransferase [Desulfovibrionaceae bacterium]
MRKKIISYGRHLIDQADIDAVTEALQSGWLTGGPAIVAFEEAVARLCGAAHAVAVCNGTAALHCAMHALRVAPGDEVIVPPMTFCATANAVVYQGGEPVFADVAPGTLLLDPASVEASLTPRTKGIVAVDYAGQPCDYDALRAIADAHGLFLAADACHSLGGAWNGRPVGSLADVTCLSFHPVKHITTGEGGMILCDDPLLAETMRRFRNHGIDADPARRAEQGVWRYDMGFLGHNYRITDIQCALGGSQLDKLPQWLTRRREVAAMYAQALRNMADVSPLEEVPGATHALHLYVVRIASRPKPLRDAVLSGLRARGVQANVHYVPANRHSYYRQRLGDGASGTPVCDKAFEEILSLPMHAGLTDEDVRHVLWALGEALLEARA